MAFVFQIMNTLKNLFFGLTGSSLLCKGLPQFRALSSLQQGGGALFVAVTPPAAELGLSGAQPP